jgi:hypothetical protein
MNLFKHLSFAVLILLFFTGEDVWAQRRGTQQKKYNTRSFRQKERRISNYTGGGTAGFSKAKKYSSIGVTLAAFNYFGEMAPKPNRASFDFSFTRPGFGIVYTKKLLPRVSARGTLAYGRISGGDESADMSEENLPRFKRNLNFRNSIIELTATAMVYLFDHHGTANTRLTLNPYIFAGVGIIRHNPQGQIPEFNRDGTARTDAGEWVDLEPLGTEGQYSDLYPDVEPYSLFQVVIPAGIGVTYELTPELDLSFEIGYRHLFTDHLDDVGGEYANYDDIGEGDPNSIAAVMSDKSYELAYRAETQDLVTLVSGSVRDMAGGEGAVKQLDNLVPGYGYRLVSGEPQVRGSSSDNDIYFVTAFHLTYILGGKHGKAKFR